MNKDYVTANAVKARQISAMKKTKAQNKRSQDLMRLLRLDGR